MQLNRKGRSVVRLAWTVTFVHAAAHVAAGNSLSLLEAKDGPNLPQVVKDLIAFLLRTWSRCYLLRECSSIWFSMTILQPERQSVLLNLPFTSTTQSAEP